MHQFFKSSIASSKVLLSKSRNGLAHVNVPIMIGFSLCQLWVSLCFFLPQIFPGQGSYYVYDLSLIVTMVTLIPAFIWTKRCEELLTKKRSAFVLASIACIGSFLVPFSDSTTYTGTILQYFAAILTGFSAGWLFMMWYQTYCRTNDLTGFVLSIMISSVFMYIFSVIGYAPESNPWITVAITCVMPFVSIAFMRSLNLRDEYMSVYELPHPSDPGAKPLIAVCCSIFVVSFVSEFTRNYYLNGTDLVFYSGSINLLLLLLKIISSAFIIGIILSDSKQINVLFKAAFLLAMIAVLFMPYAAHVSNLFYGMTNFAAFLFKSIVLMIGFNYCRHYRIAPLLIFALMRIVFSFDLLAGYHAYLITGHFAHTHIDIFGIMSVILGVAIMFTYLFVFTQQNTLGPAYGQDIAATNIDSLRERCDYLASLGSLTPRETEIFLLIAKGRSTPRIQEELNVSANTVNTHTSHIYAKLKVHSRQELLDLIEDVNPC